MPRTPDHRRHRTSMPLRALTVVLLGAVLAFAPGTPAAADGVAAAVAAARGSALPVHPEVDAVAQRSAHRIAAAGSLSHADLTPLLATCGQVGEVVGFGPSVTAIFDRFLASPEHRRIVLASGWRSIGTGVATGADGRLFVSVVFCAAPAPTSPPDTTPAPPPPAAPRATSDGGHTHAPGPTGDGASVGSADDLERAQRHLSKQLGMSFEAFLAWLTEGPPPVAD